VNIQSKLLDTPRTRQQSGSTIVTVLGFIVVTSMVFGAVLTRGMHTFRQVSHIASWQEALLAAESGSDTGMNELRKTLVDPTGSFAGWSTVDANGVALPNHGRHLSIPQIVHAGEGNTQLDVEVTVDAPRELNYDGNVDYVEQVPFGSPRQWYRIRSTGTTYLPGAARITPDKRDHLLRQLSFVWNPKTKQPVARPQSSRLVELLVKPTGFENAIVSDLPINLNNEKITVDSYDSRYANKSTNGLYDPAKRLENGDVATNSQLLQAGDAHIYGDAYTNAGTIQNGANIAGEQHNDYYQELNPIKKPEWTNISPGPPVLSGSTTLTGGTEGNPKRYKFNSMSITGNEVLTFAPSSPGVESYTEVWITGDFKTSGSGSIVVQPGANVKIFLEGNADIKGNGTMNANSRPVQLQILAVEPPGGSSRTMNFSGNGVIVAAIYAPDHDIVFGATGSAGTMWGSLTGKSLTMGGTTFIHYDEALADLGYVTNYKIRSWFEDAK
jgi:hypothetical protein